MKCLLASVTVCMFHVGHAYAGLITVDQENQTTNFAFDITPGLEIGQSFIPTLSQIDAVELLMRNVDVTTGSAIVTIKDGFGGTILASSALTDVGTVTDVVHFDLLTPVIVPDNNTTPFFLFVSNENAGATMRASTVTSALFDTYPDGIFYNSSGARPLEDMWFREGTHVPEPSSLALLATGAIGLLAYRRRKRNIAE